MRIGSLFSGYGGADLAVQSVFPDATPAWFVEYDKHPSTILAKRFPGVKNYGDVTTVDWAAVEPVDILTAGWPCQPFSHAGQRRGTDDDRHLWPYVADAVRVLRPRYLFGENVAGHLSLGFDTVLADLAALGFDARWGVVRASDASAPHRRARLFIIATDRDTDSTVIGHRAQRRAGVRPDIGQSSKPGGVGRATADAAGEHEWPQSGRDRRRQSLQATGNRDRSAAHASGGSQPGTATAGDGLPVTAERGRITSRPASADGRPASDRAQRRSASGLPDFGPYAAAVARWELVTGRPAPAPTEPGRTGPRLNPAFVEWMMGLPAGWVTDTGIPRNAQLKALGNGIVWQQMALALRLLLAEEVAV